MGFLRVVIPSIVASLGIVCGSERTFTNTEGVQIRAEVVEINGDTVVLEMGGRNYPVPISNLSAADQEFLGEWDARHGDGAVPEGNWDGPWPRLISVSPSQEIEILQDGPDTWVYASPHYEFHCNVRLNTSVVRRFALLFEATNQFCRELPLGMVKPFQEKRFRIDLCETEQEYAQMGGPGGTAGVYFGGKDTILVPLSSLGVKKVGSGYSIDHGEENSTLAHEICHQLTDREYYVPGARGWFTEGLAEYIATSGYRSGKFNVDDINALRDYVTAYGENNTGGRALGDEIRVPRFEHWAQQSYESFTEQGNLNYGVAALVMYYFFHMDGAGDARNIKEFLKKLKSGVMPPEAYQALLAGRTFEQLEEDIYQAWRGRGIRLYFGDSE